MHILRDIGLLPVTEYKIRSKDIGPPIYTGILQLLHRSLINSGLLYTYDADDTLLRVDPGGSRTIKKKNQ